MSAKKLSKDQLQALRSLSFACITCASAEVFEEEGRVLCRRFGRDMPVDFLGCVFYEL